MPRSGLTPAVLGSAAPSSSPTVNNPKVIQNDPNLKNLDKNVFKNIAMIFNMLHVYQNKNGEYPATLSELENNYFPGTVPINDSTGQPFHYESFEDSLGKRSKYILCPSTSSDPRTCYGEYLSGVSY